jgi:hypothetical protein
MSLRTSKKKREREKKKKKRHDKCVKLKLNMRKIRKILKVGVYQLIPPIWS